MIEVGNKYSLIWTRLKLGYNSKFTKFLELMKMSVQFQKPLVLLEWQARHQRGSRCARAGQVSGYYGVAMQIKDSNSIHTYILHSEIVTSQAKG